MIWHGVIQYGVGRIDSMSWHGLFVGLYGTVRCGGYGMVRYGMVRCEVVQYGVISYGMICIVARYCMKVELLLCTCQLRCQNCITVANFQFLKHIIPLFTFNIMNQ